MLGKSSIPCFSNDQGEGKNLKNETFVNCLSDAMQRNVHIPSEY